MYSESFDRQYSNFIFKMKGSGPTNMQSIFFKDNLTYTKESHEDLKYLKTAQFVKKPQKSI